MVYVDTFLSARRPAFDLDGLVVLRQHQHIMMRVFFISASLLYAVRGFAVPVYETSAEGLSCDSLIADAQNVDGEVWDTFHDVVTYPDPYVRCLVSTPAGDQYFEWRTACLAYAGDRCATAPDGDPAVGTTNAGVEIYASLPVLSADTTYYLGAFVRFERVNDRDIWLDAGSADSFDKLMEFAGTGIRWGVASGWPSGVYSATDGKFTFGAWCADSVFDACQTPGDYDHKEQNAGGHSAANPYLADYNRWYAVVLAVTISDTSSGHVRLYVNGEIILDLPHITAGSASPSLDHLFVNGTIAQPTYDAPEHWRQIDRLMFTSDFADIDGAGLMTDPQGPPDLVAPASPTALQVS